MKTVETTLDVKATATLTWVTDFESVDFDSDNPEHVEAIRDVLAQKESFIRSETERLKEELKTAQKYIRSLQKERDAAVEETERHLYVVRIRNKLGANPGESVEDAAYRVAAERDALRAEVERLNKAAANVLNSVREALVRKCADAAVQYWSSKHDTGHSHGLRYTILRAGGVEP